MHNVMRVLLAGAIALGVSTPAAAQFTGAYFFGDSYTDIGSFKPVLPPGTGMFTTNPGPVWTQPFAQYFGYSASPANQGGNDYAYGGARVTQVPGYPPAAPTAAAVPIAMQVQQFLAKGPLDRSAIYSVWGGANDFFTQLSDLQAGTITTAQAQANLALAATQLVEQFGMLRAAGAQYILFWSYPAAAATPAYAGNPSIGQISQFESGYYAAILGALNASGIPTIRVNVRALVNEIVANPAAYGFTNVTAPACGTAPSLTCTSGNLVAPNAASTYLFADGVHPTTAGHAIFAQAAVSMITGPQQIAALGEAPFAVEEANFRALDGRMWSSLDTPRSRSKFEAWAVYDYGNIDMNAGPSNGSGHQNTVVVGGDIKLSDRMLVGVMFGYTDQSGDFGGSGGGYELRQPVGTIYAGYGEGPWYVGATFGGGSLDYSDINRTIPLGALLRTESGETRGNEYTGRLLGGYWFKWQDILHGPYARVAYTKVTVKQYAESGSDSTALIYGEQKPDQLLWSLGWQAQGNIGMWRPFARAAWQYDSLDNDRNINASSVTLGGSYSVPASKPDNNYVLFNLGTSADFGGVTGFVYGSATAGRGDGNYYAITVGIRAPL